MINQLKEAFNFASDKRDATKEFLALLEGYKNIFGTNFDSFLYFLYEHNSANLYDYLDSHFNKKLEGLLVSGDGLKELALSALCLPQGSEEQIKAKEALIKKCVSIAVVSEEEVEKLGSNITNIELIMFLESKCLLKKKRAEMHSRSKCCKKDIHVKAIFLPSQQQTETGETVAKMSEITAYCSDCLTTIEWSEANVVASIN